MTTWVITKEIGRHVCVERGNGGSGDGDRDGGRDFIALTLFIASDRLWFLLILLNYKCI